MFDFRCIERDDALKALENAKPQPPAESKPIRLEYWHFTEAQGTHPVLLLLMVLLGIGPGLLVVLGCGAAIFGAVESQERDLVIRAVALIWAVIWLALLAACIHGLKEWASDGWIMSTERRRCMPRYFRLGVRVGIAMACLLNSLGYSIFAFWG